MNKKLDLLLIISITILMSVGAIVAFNLEFGLIKIGQQLTRLIILVVFSYFLYKEKQWARWVFVVMSLLAGLAGILGALSVMVTGDSSFVSATVILGAGGLFYLASGIYIGFIRKWKK